MQSHVSAEAQAATESEAQAALAESRTATRERQAASATRGSRPASTGPNRHIVAGARHPIDPSAA
jgi:hypothetical protein